MDLVVSDKKFFENCILKNIFLPCDLLMQPIGTVCTILVEDNPGIIPVEFGQIPISSLGEELFNLFLI